MFKLGFDGLLTYLRPQAPCLPLGAVRRAANLINMIASGNHSIMHRWLARKGETDEGLHAASFLQLGRR